MEKKATYLANELSNLVASINLSKKESVSTQSASSSSSATAAQLTAEQMQQMSISVESTLVKQFRLAAAAAA